MASVKPQVVPSKLKKPLGYVFLKIVEDRPDQLCFKPEGEVTWPGLDGVQIRDKIRAIMDLFCGAQLTDRT